MDRMYRPRSDSGIQTKKYDIGVYDYYSKRLDALEKKFDQFLHNFEHVYSLDRKNINDETLRMDSFERKRGESLEKRLHALESQFRAKDELIHKLEQQLKYATNTEINSSEPLLNKMPLTSCKAVDCLETVQEDSIDGDITRIKEEFNESLQDVINRNVKIAVRQILKQFKENKIKGNNAKFINEKQTFIFPNQASYTVYPSKK